MQITVRYDDGNTVELENLESFVLIAADSEGHLQATFLATPSNLALFSTVLQVYTLDLVSSGLVDEDEPAAPEEEQ